MPRKRHKPEEIVSKLRQVDVLVSQGQPVAEAVRLKELEKDRAIGAPLVQAQWQGSGSGRPFRT